MGVITEVLDDLYKFAVVYWFGFRNAELSQEKSIAADEFIKPHRDTRITNQSDTATADPKLLQNSPEPVLLDSASTLPLERVGYAYTPEAFVYALPTRMFDGVVERLPYGTSFVVVNQQGKWLQISYKETKGWMYADDVSESVAALNPQFTVGEVYNGEHEDAIKLRTRIDDQFHAAGLELPLQNVEYVTYRLLKKNHTILWPPERPRIAGTWQRLLKGVRGVHLGVHPKTDTAMEYINADNTGHVAYVESVFPDDSVAISEIGYPSEGVYSERVLSKIEWKELRPIFIEVA